jgi:enoyl-CoA hydratase
MNEPAAIEIGDVAEGVVQITIRRPESGNSLRETEHDLMGEIWSSFDRRDEVRAIVVTGEGRLFCAGGDTSLLDGVVSDDKVRINAWWAARSIVRGLLECRKPVVSAVEGAAVGAGTAIALMADICIAAEDAKLIDGHLPFGASPGDHAAFLWPLAIGINRARGLLMLGEPVTGRAAAEMGLVFEAVPAGQTLARAHEIAKRLASHDPFAMAATKTSLNALLRQNWQTFEASLALEFMCFGNKPAQEAIERAAGQRSR